MAINQAVARHGKGCAFKPLGTQMILLDEIFETMKKKSCTLYIPLTHTLFHHEFKRSKSGSETKAAERFAILMSTQNGPLIASG